ncbi:succinate dehydrogenase and fumarate reductase iron-sulfur protein [Caldisphaera lagunensis DSM 15908]|uniref:succinate dehydrogenase n=1 Tax=Caldisphaera lagunensis (strain DSM 15908 / JCM 11604 / ANMR 0165 / IC-154) TaxID=1056495 RepID=L0AA31_CALLD|nr:succinate dehydrogenase iron-sulfur subunit [Caldisphaera lagunensis]AFZ70716.1 succinate dehydrogenase and fumarate reductase iron-sulfur protein [Caldisphaera lagunensis DSM 15908]
MNGNKNRTVKLKIKRYLPDKGEIKEFSYEVKVNKYTTVLDALINVKETQDPSIAIRYSCRMGICGSCGMVIDGKPRLACQTHIETLKKDEVVVGPMEGHPILKDLVTDMDEFFSKHKYVIPWIYTDDIEEKFNPKVEYKQDRRELDYYLPFSYCIKCGLCVDACPISNSNPAFLGPQALAQAYRYNSDSRDKGEKLRLVRIDTPDGVWGCEFIGACSEVCPIGVDPALAIQLLKLDVMRFSLTGKVNNEKKVK